MSKRFEFELTHGMVCMGQDTYSWTWDSQDETFVHERGVERLTLGALMALHGPLCFVVDNVCEANLVSD